MQHTANPNKKITETDWPDTQWFSFVSYLFGTNSKNSWVQESDLGKGFHVCTYMNTKIQWQTCIHIFTCMHIITRARTHTHTHTHTRASTHTCSHTHRHTHERVHASFFQQTTYMHSYIHTCIHTYNITCIHSDIVCTHSGSHTSIQTCMLAQIY